MQGQDDQTGQVAGKGRQRRPGQSQSGKADQHIVQDGIEQEADQDGYRHQPRLALDVDEIAQHIAGGHEHEGRQHVQRVSESTGPDDGIFPAGQQGDHRLEEEHD